MWATSDDGVPERQFKMTAHAMTFWKAMVAKNVAEGRWTAAKLNKRDETHQAVAIEEG
jgi:hypothetical protein